MVNEALEITLVRGGAVDIVVVVDSVCSLVPKAEIDGRAHAGPTRSSFDRCLLNGCLMPIN